MLTILDAKSNLIEIKRSKFHGYIFHTENNDQFDDALSRVKKEHPRADHIVYAYIHSKNENGYSDANEPKGTAGRPVLNVLEKNSLCLVSLFIVRYFGGIKLGAGGLVRAYTHTASDVINSCEKKSLLEAITLIFTLKYEELDRFLSQYKDGGLVILDKSFGEDVKIKAIIKEGMLPSFKSDIRILSFNVIKKDFLYPF
ncbi:MAG: YigZ family protein [bacterium]